MSRDWTPCELRAAQKQFNIPNLADMEWIIHIEGQEDKPLYSEADIALAHTYNQLGLWGFDFLRECVRIGVLSNEKGQQIIQSIEDYYNGADLDNKELREKVDLWYEGQLEPGYDLYNNNLELANYIKTILNHDVEL